jgi:intracellular sulfur oxidation DsrE/DsrF family protein
MSGRPLHVHTYEDEFFYVLNGDLAFEIDGARHTVLADGVGLARVGAVSAKPVARRFERVDWPEPIGRTTCGIDDTQVREVLSSLRVRRPHHTIRRFLLMHTLSVSLARWPLRRVWRHRVFGSLTLGVSCFAAPVIAQLPAIPGQQMSGPVINSTGMSIKVDDPTFVVPASHIFKAVFEINAGGGDTLAVNGQLNNVARYFNLHARNGVATAKVKAAAVFHGSGWPALLTDAAFAARFGGKPNPSRALTEELLQHGTQLVLCGQTAGVRGIRRDELLPGVKVAISAMTAMQFFQSEGYAFIAW